MPQFRPRQTKRAQELRNNATEAERRLWAHLRQRRLGGFKFTRQMSVGPFVCDFVCRERGLVVELDGGQHAERTAEDARRTAFLEREGLSVVRFWNNDVFDNLDGVLQLILASLERLPVRFGGRPLPLAGGDEARSAEGAGPTLDILAQRTHPLPPPASGRGQT
ncbi:MAG: endonuclease domain-containing protein [Bacillota bacterium]